MKPFKSKFREQIGFGLGNNWNAFGGTPDLGLLPLDDYHLEDVIIKLAQTPVQNFGLTLSGYRSGIQLKYEVLGMASFGCKLERCALVEVCKWVQSNHEERRHPFFAANTISHIL